MRGRHASDDTGAVAVILAIVLLVVVGISALAVDVGYWYTAKRQLQSAADAAALAGCTALVKGEDVEAAVDRFAKANFLAPLDPAPTSKVASLSVGPNYVKVTVKTDAHVFLSYWFHKKETTLVQAQAVAKAGYLAGARAPVPWGLSILRIGKIQGILGGETAPWVTTAEADGYWKWGFSEGRSGALTIEAVNSGGYTDTFSDLVVVGSPKSRIVSVDVDKSTLTLQKDKDGDVVPQLLHVKNVQLASELKDEGTVEADFGDGLKPLSYNAALDTYEGYIPVTFDDTKMGVSEQRTLTVTVTEPKAGKKNQTDTESVSCTLLLRRPSYILQDVDVHPVVVGTWESVTVRVKTLDFTYGNKYELKVVPSAQFSPGNFGALAFAGSDLDHKTWPCDYPDTLPVEGNSGAKFYELGIKGDSNVVAHIDDLVDLLPGDKMGKTRSGINDRLKNTNPIRTLAEWETATPPRPDTKQLLIVPIVERLEPVTGRKPVRIVAFATFFLEPPLPTSNDDPVYGTFIEWTAPGWFVVDDPPSGGLSIETVHLVADDLLDF